MNLVDIKELQFAFYNEHTNKIKLLQKLLFWSECDRSNRKRISDFTGFGFQTSSTEFKDSNIKV